MFGSLLFGATPFSAVANHNQTLPPGCPAAIYDPAGRQGIGVVQPQSGLNYPFIAPSANIRNLLADLYLAYEEPSDYTSIAPTALPLKIAWLYGLGCIRNDKPLWAPEPINPVEIIIHDADGATVFDSTEAEYYDEQTWGSNYTIYEWRTDVSVLRIVAFTTWSPDKEPTPKNYLVHIEPTNGTLDARAIYRLPKRVRSLRLVLDTFTKTNVDLVAGYNMQLQATVVDTANGSRNKTQLVINATPGAGDGIFPGCVEPDVVLRSINGVGPTTVGDFLLGASDCYWIRQPTTVITTSPLVVRPSIDMDPLSGHLQLGNDCGPCCSCDDFVETAQYLNRIWAEGAAVGRAAESVRDQYHLNRERWNIAKTCLEQRPLRLALQPQNCPFLDVLAQYCNQTDKCVTNVVLIIRLKALPIIEPSCDCDYDEVEEPDCTDPVPALPDDLSDAEVKVVCGHTILSGQSGTSRYTMAGKWCEYRAYFDAIEPHASAYVKFRLEFPSDGKGLPDGSLLPTPYAISGCLRASVEDKWLCVPPGDPQTVAVDRQSAVLECGGDGTGGTTGAC
jgi:hypothetical protein